MALIKRIRSIFGDPALAVAVLALTAFGIAMIKSAGQVDVPGGPASAWRQQIMWLIISLVGMALVMRIQARWIEWIALPAYLIGVAALIATLIIGTGKGTAAGVKSWIVIGPLQVQPSQFANLATILMLGRVMGNWREAPNSLFGLWKPILIVAVPMGLVFLQPDLGTSLVFGGMLLATLYWAGTPLGILFLLISPLIGLFTAIAPWVFSLYMIGLIVFLYFYRVALPEAILIVVVNIAAGTVAAPLWNSLDQYQKNRLLVFLTPEIDP